METVLITGGTGLIGSYLTTNLIQHGFRVRILTRGNKIVDGVESYQWDVENYTVDPSAFHDLDYIVHLAGANIGTKRWTNSRKKVVINSRINSTKLLLDKVKEHDVKLKAFISASAVGYYGSVTTDKAFKETDSAASDFLGTVCSQWENAVDKFELLGIRTVKVRTGVVLASNSEVVQKTVASAKYGVGVVLGNGDQYVPWIHIADLVRVYTMAIQNHNFKGAYNAVAPEDTANKEFTLSALRAFGKKGFTFSIPAFVLRCLLGQLSTIVLHGSKVSVKKLMDEDYQFLFPKIDAALEDLLE